MKSSKKIISLLLTLFVLVLSLTALFACKNDGYTVSFDSNGGTSVSSITVAPGEKATAPAIPTKDGYSFAGWTTTDGVLWNFETPITADTLLIAEWVKSSDANMATVTFDFKGGTAVEAPAELSVVKGSVIEEPKTPIRAGYSFDGWYYLNEKFSFTNTVIAGDMTLTAKWTAVNYTISYELGGGTGANGNPTEYTVESDTVKIANPTRLGYEFLGWTTEGADVPVSSLELPKGTVGDKVYVANWSLITYKIEYDYAGGNVLENAVTEYSVNSVDIAVGEPTRLHYDFIGWTYEGQSEPVKALVIKNGTTGTYNLVANWKPTEYTIVYDIADGTNNVSNPAFVTIESEAVTLSAPSRPGYKFVGWTYEGQEEPTMTVTIEKGTTEVKTFVAVWELDTYTITYFSNNGVTQGEEFVNTFMLGDLPIKLPDMHLNNKCFISWYTDENFENPISSITEYANFTLYAKFVDPTVDLIFDFNGVSYDVIGYTGSDPVVYIPEYYKDTLVTSISAEAFYNNDTVTDVYLPISLTKIGAKAFYNCDNLNNVYIDSDTQLKTIEKLAFAECFSITEFKFPTALEAIGAEAFKNCDSLVEIILPANLRVLESNIFNSSDKLERVIFPENSALVEIEDFAFYNCVSLKSIKLPDDVLSIGGSAFYNCKSLESIEFSKGLVSIGDFAFNGCGKLTKILLPETDIEGIGRNAFFGCNAVEVLELANAKSSNKSVSLIFGGKAPATIKSLTIHGGEAIDENAFANCTSLESITLPFAGTSEDAGTLASLFGESIPESLKTVTIINLGTEAGSLPENAFVGSYVETVKLVGFERISNSAFKNVTSFKTLDISESAITSIGSEAFAGCTSIVSIALPDTITSIEQNAFIGCESLTSIELPLAVSSGDSSDTKTFEYIFGTVPVSLKTVTIINSDTEAGSLPENVFVGSYVETVKLVGFNSISKGAFENVTSFKALDISESTITSIESGAFEGCTGLTSFTVPKTVVSIGSKAFTGSAITSLAFEDESVIETIGSSAFKDCVNLTEINIPNTVKAISDSLFMGCSGLAKITLTDNITSIGSNAFENCTSLASVEMTDGSKLSTIKKAAFKNTALTSFTIPKGVSLIPESAFENCALLTSIVFAAETNSDSNAAPATVAEFKIGKNAFANSALASIAIPANVVDIQENAFANCSALASVTFAENSNLSVIGNGAFKNCSSLREIAIPDKISSIANEAFKNCTSLASVTFGEKSTLTSILANAFEYCTALKSFNLPKNVDTIGKCAFANCFSLESFVIPQRTSELVGETTVTTEASLREIAESAFMNCDSLKEITLPASLVTIGDNAFYSCGKLEKVLFEDKSIIETISSYAFRGCEKLSAIAIPDSVKTIKKYAFYNCTSLESVTFGEMSALMTIEESAFRNCEKLKTFVCPDSVTEIGKFAFESCTSLESIKLTVNVGNVDSYAFKNCEKLVITVVYYADADKEGAFDNWGSYWNFGNNGIVWELYVAPSAPQI